VNWYGEIIYKKGFGTDAATGRKIVMNWRQQVKTHNRATINWHICCGAGAATGKEKQ